jgi:hypothetical protein
MNNAVTAPSPTSHPANNASAVGFGLGEFSTSTSAEMIFTGDHATTIAGATSSASNSPQLPDMDGPLIYVHDPVTPDRLPREAGRRAMEEGPATAVTGR